jgi:hypothetical protein
MAALPTSSDAGRAVREKEILLRLTRRAGRLAFPLKVNIWGSAMSGEDETYIAIGQCWRPEEEEEEEEEEIASVSLLCFLLKVGNTPF